MKVDFSKLLTGNGIKKLLEGKTENIQLEVIEEDSIENCQIIVSDGSSQNKAILLKDAALLYRKMGSLKYRVISIKKYNVQNNDEGKVIIITKMEIDGQETNLENLGVNSERARERITSKYKGIHAK